MTDINVTAELEVDDGTGVTRQFSVEDLQVAQTGAAADTTLSTGLGTDGATPPTIAGTGIRGWLRAIYERLISGITVTGPATDAQLRATPLPITGTVTATVDESTLAKDATLGTPGSSPPAMPGNASGLMGWLRLIYNALTGTLTTNAAVSNFPATQAVSAAALPLPAGAGTAANQASILTKLGTTLLVDSSTLATATGQATLHTDLGLLAKKTDTQPVSAVLKGTGTNTPYQVTVSANATQLRPAVAARVGVFIQNLGPGILYVGKSSADTPTGTVIAVPVNGVMTDPETGIAPDTGIFYGSPESGKTCDVRIWETT